MSTRADEPDTMALGSTKATGNQPRSSPRLDDVASGPPPVVAVVGGRTSASRRWSTASWAGAKRWCKMCPALPVTASPTTRLWTGRRFMVQDTGGWEPDAKGLQQLVAEQAAVAMRTADAIILVVDAVVGATAGDEAAARLLRAPANQCSWPPTKSTATRANPTRPRCGRWVSGSRIAVSAIHGRGVADLLDALVGVLPEVAELGSSQRRSATGGAGRQAQRRARARC